MDLKDDLSVSVLQARLVERDLPIKLVMGSLRDLLAPAGHRPPVARNMAADVGAARLESNAICA